MATRKRAKVGRYTPSQRAGGLYEQNVLGRGDRARATGLPPGRSKASTRQPGHKAPGPGRNVMAYEDVALDSRNRYHVEQARAQALAEASREAGDWALNYAYNLAEAGDTRLLLPYQPTRTSTGEAVGPNMKRRRTVAAGYDRKTQTLRVVFRDGAPWVYYDVPPAVWANFKRVQSPGRFIQRTLDRYPYGPGDW